MRRAVWLTLVVAVNAILATLAQGQTNSWTGPADGKWDRAKDWNDGLPSIAQSAVIITNASGAAVTINTHNGRKFSSSLVISNLFVGAPSLADTVYLDNTGTTALHILNNLTVGLSFDTFGGEEPGVGALISTNSTLVVDGLSDGEFQDDGTMIFAGGTLITTNCNLEVGPAFAGLLIVSNGVVQARTVTIDVGESTVGTIEVIGGTMTLSSTLSVGGENMGSLDRFLVRNGGLLVVTNGETILWGSDSEGGIMTVSNGTFLGADVILGGAKSGGTLEVDSGTVTLNGELGIAFGDICDGSASLNGGLLVVTNNSTVVGGDECSGELTISDGLFLAREILVGSGYHSGGRLIINGGTTQLSSYLQVGSLGIAPAGGSVFVNGGQLVVTNGPITVLRNPGSSITVTGGLLAANYIDLGPGVFSMGTLAVSGGSITASTGITLGDCTTGGIGYVTMSGGQVTVTNAAHAGFIDVQNGQLNLSGGLLQVDKLVMTNSCSQFIHTGGTLMVGSVVLDPNAFAITSVAREGNDLRVTWLMGPGATNALQVSSGGSHGGYGTNGFADIFVVTNNIAAGTVTNFLDLGAATNRVSRYYRARLAL
jgi:hypothetical protein